MQKNDKPYQRVELKCCRARSQTVFKVSYGFIRAILVCMLAGSWLTVVHAAEGDVPATLVYFEESEPGVGSYQVRYVLNQTHLRIDDGEQSDGFVLFERETGTIYSVSHRNRSVLEVPPDKDAVPAEILAREKQLSVRELVDKGEPPPAIGGKPVSLFSLGTASETCVSYSVAVGLLPDAVGMLKAYRQALAHNSRRKLINQPPEYLTDCMIINDVFAAKRYLGHGFPVMVRKHDGATRILAGYEISRDVNAALFQLPPTYRVIGVGLR